MNKKLVALAASAPALTQVAQQIKTKVPGI
jgi:hypothetical protein